MMNRWLTIVLALVIALQSLVVIGDANQAHHPVALHQAHYHEHSHEVPVIDSSTPVTDQSLTASDFSMDHSSDHCHQNHAHYHMVLTSAATEIAASTSGERSSSYRSSHTSAALTSLFRPPIA